jgi:tellurite resistance protein
MPFQLSGPRIIPASFFGMPLGLIALGLAWRSATVVWRVPSLIEEVLIWGGSLLWMYLFAAYLAKWFWHREAAEREFQDAVQCCFVGLAGVVALLASIGLAPQVPKLAFMVFLLGSVWTLGFGVYRTGRLWMGGRKPEATTPILYLPTVAGSLVFASAATSMGHPDWGRLAFGTGALAWIAIESVLIQVVYGRRITPASAADARHPIRAVVRCCGRLPECNRQWSRPYSLRVSRICIVADLNSSAHGALVMGCRPDARVVGV